MAAFKIQSIALKWCFFMTATYVTYQEFCHVFLKQLGFSAQQIGFTSLFGVQHLFIPLLLFMADRFQARKVVIFIATVIAVINSLLPLLPLVVSLPSCFDPRSKKQNLGNNTATTLADRYASLNKSLASNVTVFISSFSLKQSLFNSTKYKDIQHENVPWKSALFLLMTFSRALNTYSEGVIRPLNNLAALTYLNKERASFGAYLMWLHIGTFISLVSSALLAYALKITICGIEGYGYFLAFIISGIFSGLSLLGLPFFEYKYKLDRKINWKDVRRVVLDRHYAYMFVLTFYFGIIVAYQGSWEFWYLDEVNASPLIMALSASVRRPLLAFFLFTSSNVIRRIGDLNPICVSFFLFALSFFGLSFTRLYWYVVALDTFQVAAYVLAYSAFTIHFSKAGNKASSGFILGLQEMFFMVGFDCGSTIFGILFHALGTQNSMLVWSAVTAIMLVILFIYLKLSKKPNEYKNLPENSDDDKNEHDDKDEEDDDYED